MWCVFLFNVHRKTHEVGWTYDASSHQSVRMSIMAGMTISFLGLLYPGTQLANNAWESNRISTQFLGPIPFSSPSIVSLCLPLPSFNYLSLPCSPRSGWQHKLGVWERCELPQCSLGRSTGRHKKHFGRFWRKEMRLLAIILALFVGTKTSIWSL